MPSRSAACSTVNIDDMALIIINVDLFAWQAHADCMTMLTDGAIEVPRGLKGVVVAETAIGDVRGEEGFYHYRGMPAIELAETRSLEDVWQLVIDGALPADEAQRRRFLAEVGPWRAIPDAVAHALPSTAPAAQPGDAPRGALALYGAALGMRPTIDLSAAGRRTDVLRLCAVVPTLLCALHRLRRGLAPIPPRDGLAAAANCLWMMDGRESTAAQIRGVEQYLISTIDHGFNA